MIDGLRFCVGGGGRNWHSFWMRDANRLVLVWASKLTWFLCGGIEIDLILELASNWLDFSGCVEINLIFVWGIEFDLVLVLGSKVTWFLCGGSKLTVCEPKLICFECDDGLTWFLCGWWWSKLTLFLDVGRKSLGVCVSIKIDLVLLRWSILTWFQCGGWNLTWFQFRDRNWFVLCLGVENDLVLVSGSNLTWILCDVRTRIDVEFW